MISLLDVNVLIALFDGTHVHHETAHRWFEAHGDAGWATCPLTENGFVRVLSNPGYPGRRTTIEDAIDRLSRFCDGSRHRFWPAAISLRRGVVRPVHVGGHRQLTDVYLLALAVHHRGRLATFDRTIPLHAVHGASAENLEIVTD